MTWPHGQGIWISEGISSPYDTPELKGWFSNGPGDWFCPHTTDLTSWQKCGISRDLFLLCLLIGQWHYQSWNPASLVGQLSLEQDPLASCELNLNLGRRFAGASNLVSEITEGIYWADDWLPISKLALWGWWWEGIMGGNQDKDPWLEIRIREAQLHHKWGVVAAEYSEGWCGHRARPVPEKQWPDHLSHRQSCVVSGFKQTVNVRFKPGRSMKPIQSNSLNLRHINLSF